MFELGKRYTREEIHDQLGGSLQSFLPHVDSRVVAACLRLDTNPDAPNVVLPGKGEVIERSARMLIEQGATIPVFLKRATAQWEFVGRYAVESFSTELAEITAQAKRSSRDDISCIIRLKRE